jgi:hypothetical protein
MQCKEMWISLGFSSIGMKTENIKLIWWRWTDMAPDEQKERDKSPRICEMTPDEQ